jgi:hypothetical protein
MGVFGAPVAFLRVVSRMRLPHQKGITPSTTGLDLKGAHLKSRSAQPALNRTTPIWDQAAHNGHSARRAFALRPAQRAISTTSLRTTRCTTGLGTPRGRHNGRFRSAICRITSQTGCLPRSPDAERDVVGRTAFYVGGAGSVSVETTVWRRYRPTRIRFLLRCGGVHRRASVYCPHQPRRGLHQSLYSILRI